MMMLVRSRILMVILSQAHSSDTHWRPASQCRRSFVVRQAPIEIWTMSNNRDQWASSCAQPWVETSLSDCAKLVHILFVSAYVIIQTYSIERGISINHLPGSHSFFGQQTRHSKDVQKMICLINFFIPKNILKLLEQLWLFIFSLLSWASLFWICKTKLRTQTTIFCIWSWNC